MPGWFRRLFPSGLIQRRGATLDQVILSTIDANTYVTPLRAMQCTAVYSCVRVLREAFAQQPCLTYRRVGRNKDRAPDYPLYRLLHDQPNLRQDAFQYWENAANDTVMRGNHYSRKVFMGSSLIPSELIPWPVEALTPKINSFGVRYYEVDDGFNKKILTSRDVFHIMDVSIDGGISGASRISVNRETIHRSIAASRHSERLFSNAARAGGILSVPENTTPEEMAFAKKEWDEKFGGGNLYGTAVLPGGMSWTALGMTGVDAQHLENMKYSETQICGIIGVPPHKIGNLDKATFSNIEHQEIEFATGSVLPLDRRIESAINTQIVPFQEQNEYFVEFLLDVLLRGDMASRMTAFSTAIAARVMNPNECRAMINMNPYDGGDEYINPAITTPTGKGDTANVAQT